MPDLQIFVILSGVVLTTLAVCYVCFMVGISLASRARSEFSTERRS